MPVEPPGDERSEAVQPGKPAPDMQAARLRPPLLERSRFGGTQRRLERAHDDDAPVSRSDLGKGSRELLEDRTARINWSVLLVSSVLILAFSVWAIAMPQHARMFQTFAYERGGTEWMGSWTLFFWAFWLAWGPFVGVFLARISRGRTLREFVIAAITVPVFCDFIIVSLFGNSTLYQVLQGDTAFAELAVQSPERGWYALLGMFPGATFLIGLATLSGLLFYLTSANSGAMVMSNFSASIPDPSQGGPKWLRIFWALLTLAMLLAGGVVTMEYATLIFALPVTIIAYLVMASFYKVLRMERAEREGQLLRRPSLAPSGGHLPERSWKQRLGQLLAFPSRREVVQFLGRTVRPALDEVAAEFRREGCAFERSDIDNASGVEGPLLRVSMDTLRAFQYQVAIVEAPLPTFSGKMSRETDVYFRLEVFTQTGSGGYDLMG